MKIAGKSWLIKKGHVGKEVPSPSTQYLELVQLPFVPEDKEDTWKTGEHKQWTVMKLLSCKFNKSGTASPMSSYSVRLFDSLLSKLKAKVILSSFSVAWQENHYN